LNRIVKLIRILTTGPYASAFVLRGVPAAAEHASVLGPLACSTVIDVGANTGQFALVARRCFPKAHLISFEPLPRPFRRLQKVIERDPLSSAFQVALGDTSGETTIHVAQHDHSSSLLPITTLQSTLFPGTAEKLEQTIRVGRLGEFVAPSTITPPAMLKLDVQGYELPALQGCSDLLDRFLYVYVECSFVELYEGQALAGEVVVWLSAHGFSMTGVHNALFDTHHQAIQADFLFKNNRVAG
jgi:FkbM family methyltransferase